MAVPFGELHWGAFFFFLRSSSAAIEAVGSLVLLSCCAVVAVGPAFVWKSMWDYRGTERDDARVPQQNAL